MTRPRAEVPDKSRKALQRALAAHQKAAQSLDRATLQLQAAVVAALESGGSFRAVAEETGMARSTIQEWARQARAARASSKEGLS